MERNGDEEISEAQSDLLQSVRSRADPVLIVCKCFSFVTALTAILCILVNVLSAIRSFKDGAVS